MKILSTFLPLSVVLLLGACKESSSASSVLADPSDLRFEQTDARTLSLSWLDNCPDEDGYYVFLRDEKASYYVKPLTSLPSGSQQYSFTELTPGKTYWLGVQAFRGDEALSTIVYTDAAYVRTLGELNYVEDDTPKCAAPDAVAVEVLSDHSLHIIWSDQASDETAYQIYLRQGEEIGFQHLVATLPADSEEYLLEDLSPSETYTVGVQAQGARVAQNSAIVASEPIRLSGYADGPSFEIREVLSSPAFIAVDYSIGNFNKNDFERGICLSTSGLPSVNDLVFPGPAGKSGLQVLSASALEYGVTYRLRAYVKSGEEIWYSPSVTASLSAAPEPIVLGWTPVEGLDLPASIRVFRTEDRLEGRPFKAWYAEADLAAGDVEFRVLFPENGKATIDDQARSAGDCYVLVNGGIFNQSSAPYLPIGFDIYDGKQSAWRTTEDLEVDHQYWSADGKRHFVSRGLFGVDQEGVPGVYWSYTPAYGQVAVYERPIPSVAGEALYREADGTFPCAPAEWVPYQAVTCGPVLLQGGRYTVDDLQSAAGHWLCNYELWANDIFGVNYQPRPDRTAVGYREDGSVVLLICDGRIAESEGATTLEMARLMKGLGCVGALNLDGGGSTGMWADGEHLNSLVEGTSSPYNRPVKSTLGFFKKR